MKELALLWFRQDLRVSDNPALSAALESGRSVVPVYVLDDTNAGDWKMGGASRVWLHHSLKKLDESLAGALLTCHGDATVIIPALVKALGVDQIFWNRCYEPWRIQRDKTLKCDLENTGVTVQTFNGSLLWEPWEIAKKDGTPYKVFTPFYRNGCLNASSPRAAASITQPLNFSKPAVKRSTGIKSITIDELELLPDTLDWHKTIMSFWQVGEEAANQKMQAFIGEPIQAYKARRDFPAEGYGSRLSPHLHFGEISPHQAWQYAHQAPPMPDEANRQHFLSELGWREFSYYLLYHWPDLTTEPFNKKFRFFPWKKNKKGLDAWQRGQTGYPIVDAGMRELWQTGFMHNRVRMIVASFLVKNQLIHWHEGEQWFWDCLLDADLAANSASWQWVAGCGADAAPYFRIFNPVTQSQRFDPEGEYIRRFCPELKGLPNKYLFKPWEADREILQAANVRLGKDYPKPILDLKETRAKALLANQSLKDFQ